MGSGKGWTAEESVTACRAFVAASEDPLAGAGKKKDLFHGQVLNAYNEIMIEVKSRNSDITYPARTGDAIAQRYRKAKCECLKFEGIIAAITAKQPTGSPGEDDIMRAAQAVYNGDATIANMYTYFRDSTVDAGATFPFYDCLRYLRQTAAWAFILSSKLKKTKSSSVTTSPDGTSVGSGATVLSDGDDLYVETGDSTGANSTAGRAGANTTIPRISDVAQNVPEQVAQPKRPTGTKRAHEATKQYHALNKGAEGIAKLAEASQKRNKVAEEMLSVEKQQSLVALFSMPGTDEALRKRFIELSQLKAIATLEKEVGATTTDEMLPSNQENDPNLAGALNPLSPNSNSDSAFTGSQSVLSLFN